MAAPDAAPAAPLTLYTVGHSTRPLAELVGLLQGAGVRLLVDIRTAPHSRTNPQFNREALEEGLARQHGIAYTWLGRELGGLRKRNKALTCNNGWENASFQGYADYMQEPAFQQGVERLLELARQQGPVAYMCAETVYFRCHRMLVSDALVARGHSVVHLGMGKRPAEHKLTRFAVVEGAGTAHPRITYPKSAAAARKRKKGSSERKRAAEEPVQGKSEQGSGAESEGQGEPPPPAKRQKQQKGVAAGGEGGGDIRRYFLRPRKTSAPEE